MENKNPTLREYFYDIIPDDSVFSYVMQSVSFSRGAAEGNHLDYIIPYFFYVKYGSSGGSTKTCQLLRSYMRIASTADKRLDELISLTDDDINQCGVILKTDTEGEYTIYYVAVECKRGRTIKLSDDVDICLGVAF